MRDYQLPNGVIVAAPGLARELPEGARVVWVDRPSEFHELHLPAHTGCGCFPRESYRKLVGEVVGKNGAFLWEKIIEYRICLN